jgi:predicted acetyltransferase
MDQFFILKKYRRQGIGAGGALKIFALHPGRWQVGKCRRTSQRTRFWREVIGTYTADNYTEEQLKSGWWQGYVQRFVSPGES